jgi:RHS repeat-associated protein
VVKSVPQHISSEETPSYYHHDQLGSTRMLTNGAGEATATFTYSPYGTVEGSSGSGTTPLGFAGEYSLSQSGLQYLRARMYDPVTGQFLSRDPIEALTRQPYVYAGDSPLNAVDRTGLWAVPQEYPCILPFCIPLLPPAVEPIEDLNTEEANPFIDLRNVLNSVFGDNEIAGDLTIPCKEDGEPTPPGYDSETWEKGPASRPSDPGENYYDPDGREWNWHSPDKYHSKGHWNVKEPGKSGEWRNRYPEDE